MLAPFIAALLLSATADHGPAQMAPVQSQPVVSPTDAPVDLEDVVVEGRRLEDMTRDFVREVGQPANGRGLARWRDGVCVGVVNLQPETAQYIADRVSTVASDIGLRAGAPGCSPSIVVIATVDASAFTQQFVEERQRLFLVGGGGMDQGRAALSRFETVDRPVRWWNVSMPVDSDTGERATRLPGDGMGQSGPGSVMSAAPVIAVRSASRLSTQIVDDAKRVYVIVDVDKISNVSLEQLSDYVAMVSLAQINAEADTSGYATVLNVFNDPTSTSGLTNWDKAYLQGLYDTQRTRQNRNSARVEIASSIIRAHHQLTTAEETTSDQP
ncbi:hypothetical protein BH09PSE1_BH09PSE1_20400 [soil metagenome]